MAEAITENCHPQTPSRNPMASPPLANGKGTVRNPEPFAESLAPNTLRVIRRNGTVVSYDAQKITVAMTKAFLAVEGGQAAASNRIHDQVQQLTQSITDTFKRRLPGGGNIHIEDIQDQVELTLMRVGAHKVAKAYVLYREERRRLREQSHPATPPADPATPEPLLHMTHANGFTVPIDWQAITARLEEACTGLPETHPHLLLHAVRRNIFDGIAEADLDQALILSTRPFVEQEPDYSYVSARLLLQILRKEALAHLEIRTTGASQAEMAECYTHLFKQQIHKGIEWHLLDPKLKKFDLDKLAQALRPERDLQFNYLGLQTLYDRYFLHHLNQRFELPQTFFMRVAMGLALGETDKEARAIEFYELLSAFDFMSSTPTLFNAGTLRPQLSSCYLTTVPDDLAGIYGAIKDNALLSKFAGGLGNDWTSVRAMGAHIRGTNGKSQGVVPFLKVANDTAVAVNQGGKRKGAVCAYLETWHLDIEEFLELRKNTGDERRRTHDMNTANWIPDLFMKRVMDDQMWTLFSPEEVPDLHDRYGTAFEEAYVQYEQMALNGQIRVFKQVSATKLWRKMLSMLFETGHPWITFKDPCNIRSPQQHVGVVHSSNLCTEITLNTSQDEIAVCNLGSINLPRHIDAQGQLDTEKLRKTITTAVRMLDNVIDINYYSVIQARRSNLKHRPIGLGIMGFQDMLYAMDLPYASEQAVDMADRTMELISFYTIEASCKLSQERGPYATFENSLWSQGILPIDSIPLLQEQRGGHLEQNRSQTLDWDHLRKQVMIHGVRNSNMMAIAPTATISNICGVSQSIEPTYQNLFVKSNLSGEFTVINPYLVRDLKALHLWDEVMVNDLKYYHGSVAAISRIPENLKSKYATAFEVDPIWLIKAASRRQKWIDQSQSLNLYIAAPSGKKLDLMYKTAWLMGLKTTYYLRSLGATNAEKSTISDQRLNAVQATPIAACSVDNPDCEACQ